MTCTIVVGPPCAGKSTFAWRERADSDLVIDYDRIALALGAAVSHGSEGDIRSAAFAARTAAIAVATASAEASWIIHTSPSEEQILDYSEAGAEFYLIDPGEDECIARARDDDRPDGTEDTIRAWYENPPSMPESTIRISASDERKTVAKSTTGGAGAANERRANRYWGEKPVPKSKTEFFNAITTPAPAGDGTVATIRMYGPIDSWGGWWGISAKDVGETLDALPAEVDQIILRINSPGGEVFEAVSILNMLRAHKATVLAVVDGLAASAASVITAGCDEAVMSPGTQMMIHKPWSFAWGSSEDMRKEAGVLDSIESSLIEIYSGKAGDADWPQLLADETWLTGPEAVELGLADRVAVIPDAGGSATVGEDEPEIIVPVETEDIENALARVATIAAATRSAATRLPSSTEPGNPNRKEDVVAYDDLKAGLRKRLGITDAAAPDETLLAALDETLEEQADSTSAAASIPEGTTLIDAGVLAGLQSDAAAGREARAQQDKERRDGIVKKALTEGRISSASRATWRAQLEINEESTTSLLNTLPKNIVPVEEIGHSGDTTEPEASLEAAAGWTDTKKEV